MKRIWFYLTIASFVVFSCSMKEDDKAQIKQEPLVKTISPERLASLLQNRNGKTLLLNVWATWCVPCVEEFPDLIKLGNHYKNSDVEIISLSIDFPDEIESKVIPFLKRFDLSFDVYVQDFKKDEDLIRMLGPEWRGAIPATFIFDGFGKQVEFISGKSEFSLFQKAIENARKK